MTKRVFPPSTVRDLAYCAFIPVLICELALSPLFFVQFYAADHAWLPGVQLLMTTLLLPLYLAALVIMFVSRASFRGILGGFAILIASVGLAVFLAYAIWGVSSGRFWTPDY